MLSAFQTMQSQSCPFWEGGDRRHKKSDIEPLLPYWKINDRGSDTHSHLNVTLTKSPCSACKDLRGNSHLWFILSYMSQGLWPGGQVAQE